MEKFLFLIYSAGLRVGEVVKLKADDIDSERMLIRVAQGKGRKDRFTVLSQVALNQLRKYFNLYKPEIWLFPGQDNKKHITERTVEKVFKNACKIAKIKRSIGTFIKTFFCDTSFGRRNRFKVYTRAIRTYKLKNHRDIHSCD